MSLGYLKCDAAGCDHREEYGQLAHELIGKPCPKCGSNLLTQEDYDATVGVAALFDALAAAGLVRPVSEGPAKDGDVRISYRHHDGETVWKITEKHP